LVNKNTPHLFERVRDLIADAPQEEVNALYALMGVIRGPDTSDDGTRSILKDFSRVTRQFLFSRVVPGETGRHNNTEQVKDAFSRLGTSDHYRQHLSLLKGKLSNIDVPLSDVLGELGELVDD